MATNNATNYSPVIHNAQVGGANGTLTNVAPSATAGVPFVSGGASADPSFTTAVVAGGGTGLTSATAYAVLTGGTTSTGAFQSIASVGTTGQVLTSNGAAALPTFQTTSAAVFPWTEVTGTSASMAINNGYIANNAGLVTLTLPTTAALGSVIRITGKGAGGWTMAQSSGQSVNFGSSTSTVGAGGSISSTNAFDSLEIVCITANNGFNVLAAQGNLTVV
jgi:hypothetical protein